MAKPTTNEMLLPNEYDPYFQPYLELVGEGEVMDLLEKQAVEIERIFGLIDEEAAQTVHSPYSWTIKQVLGHLIDEERIFGCRAHRIGAAEAQPLAGFNQEHFVSNANYDGVPVAALLEEFHLLRNSNRRLFDRMTSGMWRRIGNCDGKRISVRAIAFLLVGHANHHLNIVKERLEPQ